MPSPSRSEKACTCAMGWVASTGMIRTTAWVEYLIAFRRARNISDLTSLAIPVSFDWWMTGRIAGIEKNIRAAISANTTSISISVKPLWPRRSPGIVMANLLKEQGRCHPREASAKTVQTAEKEEVRSYLRPRLSSSWRRHFVTSRNDCVAREEEQGPRAAPRPVVQPDASAVQHHD